MGEGLGGGGRVAVANVVYIIVPLGVIADDGWLDEGPRRQWGGVGPGSATAGGGGGTSPDNLSFNFIGEEATTPEVEGTRMRRPREGR